MRCDVPSKSLRANAHRAGLLPGDTCRVGRAGGPSRAAPPPARATFQIAGHRFGLVDPGLHVRVEDRAGPLVSVSDLPLPCLALARLAVTVSSPPSVFRLVLAGTVLGGGATTWALPYWWPEVKGKAWLAGAPL